MRLSGGESEQTLIAQLLDLPDETAQRRFLQEHTSQWDDEVADALKAQSDRFLRSDVQRSLEYAGLLDYLAELTGNPLYHALGMLARANSLSIGGLGQYAKALELYDEAAGLYRENGLPVQEARSQVGKLHTLNLLGRYDEALDVGERTRRVLEAHADHRLAAVTLNIALIHGRMGHDVEALALLERARAIYLQQGEQGERRIPWVDQNRSTLLRNLGRFDESIQASQSAYEGTARQGQTAEAARARQNLALTYFCLGRYNETLALLDEVRDVFLDDGRLRDAILVELFTSDCLLQLRRFGDVLSKCDRIQDRFSELGTQFEVAQALLNQAMAYAGLGRHDEAQSAFAKARRLFEREENETWIGCTDLEEASLLLRQGDYEGSLSAAQACAALFAARSQPIRQAQAHLIAARALAALGRDDAARRQAGQVLATAPSEDLPSLTYQAHHLLGTLSAALENVQEAQAEYERAIHELERLRGQLMVEFRADFLEDKQAVYEDMVDLCLAQDRPEQALHYAERAKSRALIDLLAYRLDLGLQARQAADRPLVDELVALQAERDRLYRRWQGREEAMEEDWATAAESRQLVRRDVLTLEKQITDLWHRLLVRNADYARDAALWQVRTDPVQPYLDAESALVEYLEVHGRLVAFVVTRDRVLARRLPGDVSAVQRLIQLIWLNLRAVPGQNPAQVSGLAQNAQGLLKRLHQTLIGPLAEALAPYGRLIVVPHGALHYLPFQALYDGASYLVQRYEISYLPGASMLRYCTEARVRAARPEGVGPLVMGHSNGGRLPYALHEARAVAARLGGQALLEADATLARLRDAAPESPIVHLAAHGEFRADNPLFSGLALEDGWLSTLDLFDMRWQASLVVLSACQTGRTAIAGGDELLGLMRGLLYTGAASLLLSLWAVEDRSTARLMETFYNKLNQGYAKGAALRDAQCEWLENAPAHAHPYFWAAFCLVGDSGIL